MKNVFLLLVIFSFIHLGSFAQKSNNDECKVLLKSISGKYEGKCKKGLAHGKGKAQGIDTYEGKFKEGYPDGYGEYEWYNGDIYKGTWKNGKRNGRGKMFYKSVGLDSMLYANWKEDIFVDEIEIAPYEITYKTSNLSRVSFRKEFTEKNGVEIEISTEGRIIRDIPIDFMGSSGVFRDRRIYENVDFPFEGKLTFSVPAKLSDLVYTYTIRFTISEKGFWKIYIKV